MSERLEMDHAKEPNRRAATALDSLITLAAARERARATPDAERFLRDLRVRIAAGEAPAAPTAARPRVAILWMRIAALVLFAIVVFFSLSREGSDSNPIADPPAEQIALLLELSDIFEQSGFPADEIDGIGDEEVDMVEDLELLEDPLEFLENS